MSTESTDPTIPAVRIVLPKDTSSVAKDTPEENTKRQALEIFKEHSIVGGSYLSTRDMGKLDITITSKKDIPKTDEQKREKWQQKIKEYYLRTTTLHVLTGHKAGSALPESVNNFINDLKIEDLHILMDQLHKCAEKLEKMDQEDIEQCFVNDSYDNPLLVRFLCICPAASQVVNFQNDPFRQTALFVCRDEVTSALIKAGADVNIQDRNGDTALTQAIRTKNLVKLAALIDAGANPTIRNHQGHTARRTAEMLWRDDKIIQMLNNAVKAQDS